MLVSVRTGNFGAVDWGALQAASSSRSFPASPIYLLLQRYYVSGLPQRRGEVNDRPADDAQSGDADRAPARRTIRDVARLAGVSDRHRLEGAERNGRLSAETRARVIRVAQASSASGRTIWRRACIAARSMTVGLISNDSFGRFTMPIMEGLERAPVRHGIAVFMCNATDDPERERQHIESAARQARRRPRRHRPPRRPARADRAVPRAACR